MHADHAGFMRTTNSLQRSRFTQSNASEHPLAIQDFRLAGEWFRPVPERPREFSQKTDLSPADHSS